MTKAVEKHARALMALMFSQSEDESVPAYIDKNWPNYAVFVAAVLRTELEAEPTEAEVWEAARAMYADEWKQWGNMNGLTKEAVDAEYWIGQAKAALIAARKARLREITTQGDGNG